MELIDGKYVEEAAPEEAGRRRKTWMRIGALAACICLVVTSAALWLFLPFSATPPDVSRYKDSEYYSVIEKLNALTYRRPTHKNNFELYVSGMFMAKAESEDMNAAPEASGDAAESPTSNYQEVTDNQVAGVIEGDIIKRSDEYIYYLRGKELCVYSIEGKDSALVGKYKFDNKNGQMYSYFAEMYLSEDCKTVTVITVGKGDDNATVTKVISLDVSDPKNISENKRVSISGFYTTSRLVDGNVLVINEFYAMSPDFSKEETFIPQIYTESGASSIPADGIISPDTLTSTRYTVVCMMDEKTLELKGSSAFLSYSENVYVSEDSIYATRGYADRRKDGKMTTTESVTEISRLAYSDSGLEFKGSVTVKGYVKDQYSLDEHNGILRVVTTTSKNSYYERYSNDNELVMVEPAGVNNGTNASLYCIDIENWEMLASVENFAPVGEVVQSVRFDGDAAYVCTSVQLSDPVFFFDLSDLENITYKDTGTIEGFSSSLVNFGDGFLLGIGRGSSWNSVKIEVYEESESGVVSVCKWELDNGSYSGVYKSYLIDRKNKFVGLGVSDFSGTNAESERYVLLYFDNYRLHELVNVPIHGYSHDKDRAVYIDGYLYIFSPETFRVEDVWQND